MDQLGKDGWMRVLDMLIHLRTFLTHFLTFVRTNHLNSSSRVIQSLQFILHFFSFMLLSTYSYFLLEYYDLNDEKINNSLSTPTCLNMLLIFFIASDGYIVGIL